MRPAEDLLSYNMRRRMGMLQGGGRLGSPAGGAGLPEGQTRGATASPPLDRRFQRPMDQSAVPGPFRPGSMQPGPTIRPAQQEQKAGNWQSTDARTTSRTGERSSVGAGQGAWTRTGGVPHLFEERRQREAKLGSGFENASRIAQQRAAGTPLATEGAMGVQTPMGGPAPTGMREPLQLAQGIQPRDPNDALPEWLRGAASAASSFRQGQPAVRTGTTGSALRGSDAEPPPDGEQAPQTGTTARAQQQAEPPAGGEQEESEEDFQQRRQAADEWFKQVTGMDIEEWARTNGVPAEDVAALLMSGYVENMDYIDGELQIRFNYPKMYYEEFINSLSDKEWNDYSESIGYDGPRWASWEEMDRFWKEKKGGTFGEGKYDDFVRAASNYVNQKLGLSSSEHEYFGKTIDGNYWHPIAGMPEGVFGRYRNEFREEQQSAGGDDESAVDRAWREVMEYIHGTQPVFDSAAVEEMTRAQQREAELRNARASRIALASGARMGVDPGVTMGQGQQMMQQAGIEAANIRARNALQAQVQNFQAEMQRYQQGINTMQQIAQAAQSEEQAELALARAMALQRAQGRLQMQMMQKQWELQNTFGLQTALDLVGDLGGAALSLYTGNVGGAAGGFMNFAQRAGSMVGGAF